MNDAMEFVDSQLGTRKYWDHFYDEELANFKDNGVEGEIWFGLICEAKMIEFLIKEAPKNSYICDIGTGNGSLLRKLNFNDFSNLYGIDYSPKAIELAKRISSKNDFKSIRFLVADITSEKLDTELECKFDILLDKGTLDAISLTNKSDREDRLLSYRQNICRLFKENKNNNCNSARFLLIFSCNFTRFELINLLSTESLCFDYELPANNTFKFGGSIGSTYRGCVFKWKG